MKIKVKVHANSSKEFVKEVEDGSLEVWLKEKAVDGKANLMLVKVLKKHLGTHRVYPKHFWKKCLLRAKLR